MKSRPNREPDFVFSSYRIRPKGSDEFKHYCYWKENILIQKFENEEYIYDIVQTEFGRIDMVNGKICNSINWVKGLKESYETSKMEEVLLND